MCVKILRIEKSRYFNVDNLKNPCIIVISLCGAKLFFDFPYTLHTKFFAGIAQLVEHNLAKVRVASSSLVSRSNVLFMSIFFI